MKQINRIHRYPCCGERAYRFELLDNNTGCKFREHTPKASEPRDAAVFSILDEFRKAIDTEPPELIFPERLTRLVARGKVIAIERDLTLNLIVAIVKIATI